MRGEVKLWPFTADPESVRDYGPLETEDGATRFEIEALRPAKDHLVVRLKGVNDRNAAERLTNTKLFVARERLPETEADDEFYHADLIGLAVVDTAGNELGSRSRKRRCRWSISPAGGSWSMPRHLPRPRRRANLSRKNLDA